MLPLLFLAALPFGAQAFEAPVGMSGVAQQPGLLRFPLKGVKGTSSKGHSKRQTDVDLTNGQQGTLYTIDLTLGTPGQTVTVQFDTGSAELWVNPVCENSFDPEYCSSFGQFTESSSFVDLGQSGHIDYMMGSVDFEYGHDYVDIGPARISQQIFGVGTNSEYVPMGIMGAGPSVYGFDVEDNGYPLIIDSLAQQGFTNSRAFSLDIRSIESDRGSVVFGGIDTKKYTGSLEKLPIIPGDQAPDQSWRYWVNLNGMSVSLANGKNVEVFSDGAQPVFLDSGYTLSGLPGPIFNSLVEAFPSAKPNTNSDTWSVDCSLADTKGSVDFTFGNTVINVPYADFIWQQGDSCTLGVFQKDDSPVLGDTFLRAAYVVYDWDNQNVHLANNEDCGENLVAIGSGPDAVPSLVGECSNSNEPTTTTTSSAPTTTSKAPGTTSEPPTTTEPPVTTKPHTHTHITTSGWGNQTTTSHGGHQTSHGGHQTSQHPPSQTTSTQTQTHTYTITSCAPTVTNCPVGHVTTEVITKTKAWCPGTTATYTLPTTHICESCHHKPTGKPTDKPTKPCVVTVTPHPTSHTVPTRVPHCTTCSPPPAGNTGVVTSPPSTQTWQPIPPPVFTQSTRYNNATATGGHGPQPSGPTAGAGKMLSSAPASVLALVLSAVVAALI